MPEYGHLNESQEGGEKRVFLDSEKRLGARQRSGEGVVRRNGCPKGCFWRVRFFSAPLRFSGRFICFKSKNLKGAEKKRTLQKHPFGQPFLRTTPSLLLWRTLRDNPPHKQ